MILLFHNKSCIQMMIVFLSAALILPVTVCAVEQTSFKTVTVMGKSMIYGDNVAAARNQAISNGLDSAVSLVLINKLTPDDLFKNFEKINETLYDRNEKFIQDYKVLTETKADRVYRVLIQATVSIPVLEEQLSHAGVMLGKKSLPKILFFIAEQKIEDIAPQYWWGQNFVFFENFSASALVEVFKEKGFTIIDPSARIQEMELGQEYQKPELTDQQVVNIGLRFLADVVVVGRAKAESTANTMGTNIRSFKGTITVRAIRLDTGQTIASSVQSAVTVNTDEFKGGRDALSAAGNLLGHQLASQIATEWLKQVHQPTLVTLVVKGTHNLKNFELFRNALNDLSGVNEIQINEMRPDEITMTVDYQENAEVLASALMLKTFDTFGLNIYEILPDNIKIEFVPR